MTNAPDKRLQQGLAALQGGQAARAQALFEDLVAAGKADSSTWLALAFARANQGNAEGTLQAVDQALSLEPRNLRALLFKADHLDRNGQSRQALSFYQAALNVGAQLPQVPADVQQGLARAAQVSDREAASYENYLVAALQDKGYTAGASSRFAESLDIAFGNKPVHYQQPTRYYFPGLPQRAFYPRGEFSWLAELEAATDSIRGELVQLMQEEGAFSPYLEADTATPHLNDSGNLGNMDWSAFYLWRDGALVPENADRCPLTIKALEAIPMPMVAGQTPTVLFSQLAPGARIPPHHGVLNTRLICHLPLIVPENCGALRVGNHQKSWREGETLIFDDSVEHEAWNHSAMPRVVLLFDIWRPELSADERHWIGEMLQAVDAYQES